MASLVFKNINKIYDNKVQAVFDFNLEVEDKEFIVLVGPSGCGKSTTLRMLAGLEEITSGEILIDDEVINDVLPRDRNIAMVFQSYALYPHMSVFDNIAFGLKLRKVDLPKCDKKGNYIEGETIYRHYNKKEIKEKVNEVAEILDLKDLLKRKPAALSGGQRQRVALGRAIVRSPKVFLMDEPLSNLDAKLRVQMRSEIARIHKRVGAITIYVTHDQTEAMTMANRIVIMKDGYVQQIGTPAEVYSHPVNMFVAGFIGSPSMNFFNGKFDGKSFVFEGSENKLSLSNEKIELLKDYIGKDIVVGLRPEDIYLADDASLSNKSEAFELECEISELLGHETIVYSSISNQKITIKVSAKSNIVSGQKNSYVYDLDSIHFFDKETTNTIK